MSAIRLFLRGVAVVFTTLIVLLGGAMAASGAFQTARFFLIGSLTDISSNNVYAVFETGEFYEITPSWERVIELRVSEHEKVSWMNVERELILWEHGQSQVMGVAFGGTDNRTWWWDEDQFAWVQVSENNPDLRDLALWNGQETEIVSIDAGLITRPTWQTDHRLWWLEQDPQSSNWKVMQWDGQETQILVEHDAPVRAPDIQFIGCGAYWLAQDEASDPLQLWNGTTASIPIDSTDPIMFVGSRDCQTFLLATNFPGERNREVFLWDGDRLQQLPYTQINFLDADTFYAAESPVGESEDWTLHQVNSDGQSIQSVQIPQARLITQPGIYAYPLNPETLIVTVSNASRISDLYRWDLTANQLYPISGEYRVREGFSSFGFFQVLDPETNRHLIWCGGLPEETANTLYQWDAQTDQVSVIQTDVSCNTWVMSDGSLMGAKILDSSKPPQFFRWDGQSVHVFPYNDQIGNSMLIFSDWFTLR